MSEQWTAGESRVFLIKHIVWNIVWGWEASRFTRLYLEQSTTFIDNVYSNCHLLHISRTYDDSPRLNTDIIKLCWRSEYRFGYGYILQYLKFFQGQRSWSTGLHFLMVWLRRSQLQRNTVMVSWLVRVALQHYQLAIEGLLLAASKIAYAGVQRTLFHFLSMATPWCATHQTGCVSWSYWKAQLVQWWQDRNGFSVTRPLCDNSTYRR